MCCYVWCDLNVTCGQITPIICYRGYVPLKTLVRTSCGSVVDLPRGLPSYGTCISDRIKHLCVVVVSITSMDVATTVVQCRRVAVIKGRQMTAINTGAVECPANLRWVHGHTGVICSTVQAPRSEGVAVQMGLAASTSNMLISTEK